MAERYRFLRKFGRDFPRAFDAVKRYVCHFLVCGVQPRGFPHCGGVACDVENIVYDLEGESDVFADLPRYESFKSS